MIKGTFAITVQFPEPLADGRSQLTATSDFAVNSREEMDMAIAHVIDYVQTEGYKIQDAAIQ